MSLYPPGPITPLGATLLLNGIDAHLWFTDNTGYSQYYLDGPASPLAPGLVGQDGIIVKSHKGLLTGSSFKHLDLQAATQDGVTWTDTVYDAGKIYLKLEAHAATPQGVQAVVDEWIGAWNPTLLHTLEYITLDGGYWYSQARLDQVWQDEIKQSPRRYFYMPLTHVCRLDNAFWNTIPSISTFGLSYESFGDTFSTAHSTNLGSNWTPMYSSGHTGFNFVAANGTVQWADSGNTAQTAVNLYNAESTDTDYQVISITLAGEQFQNEGITFDLHGGKAANQIWGRLDSSGNGICCEFNYTTVKVSRYNSHTPTLMWVQPLIIPPRRNEKWTLVCGAKLNDNPRSYAVYRGNLKILQFSEVGTGSVLGSGHRGTGFGLVTAAGSLGFGEAIPLWVSDFKAADHVGATESGQVQLSNCGTQPGYPEFLFYGPGTLSFGDGPGSSNMVTFGPLKDGQIALITTLPRLRGVVDLSPGAPTQAVPTKEIQQLFTLAFNGNTPPLVNWLENQFGIMPEQTTNLYSLLNGEYKTPLPGVSVPHLATAQQIPVSISGGSASSRVVARLVPQRTAPA